VQKCKVVLNQELHILITAHYTLWLVYYGIFDGEVASGFNLIDLPLALWTHKETLTRISNYHRIREDDLVPKQLASLIVYHDIVQHDVS
jgi:hypothetical protein